MASSGTVGATIFRVADVVESIARRCGVNPSMLAPDHLDVLTGSLWRILAHMSNRGVNLWRLYHKVYPLIVGQQVYPMAQGDIDIMRLVHRQPLRITASAVTSSAGGTTSYLSDGLLTSAFTQSSINGNVQFDWGSGVTAAVGLIGLFSPIARTYNLIFETSVDAGVSWQTASAPGSVAYAANSWNWYEIEPANSAQLFRVRETGGAIMSFSEISLAEQWNDVDITRWSLDQWSVNPNKRQGGTPRQYYFERLLTPQFNTWPIANSTDALNCMCAWTHRHIEDVGALSNTLDIPERWYQPIIDVAAFTVLPELPGADLKRYDMLKDIVSNMTLPDAEKEERDKSPIQLTMGIGVYTR